MPLRLRAPRRSVTLSRPAHPHGGSHVSRRHFSIAVCCFAVLALHGRAQEIVTPEQALGRPVGTDFQLADWEEVQAYFTQLGDASPNMRVQTVGTTTEGRDLITAVISYPSNLDRLDELKANARRIADPRGIASDEEAAALLDDSRLFLFITCNITRRRSRRPRCRCNSRTNSRRRTRSRGRLRDVRW